MFAFAVLSGLLIVGYVLRVKVKLLRRLYLPSCVVAGLVGLALLQGVDALAAAMGPESFAGRIDDALQDSAATWGQLPGLLINVVFACLFLGVQIPKASVIARRAGRQLAYGQIVAWGQYVTAIGLWLLVLGRLAPDLPSMFACILPIGFEGGHGTAAGMEPTFAHYNWPQGKDYALTSATFGILSAIVFGMALVNWAMRKGHVVNSQGSAAPPHSPADIPEDDSIGVIPMDRRPVAGRLAVRSDIVEAFSLHIAAVGIAVGLGYLAKQGLVLIEDAVPYLAKHKLLSGIPTFPLCLFGGLAIQLLVSRFDPHDHIDSGLIRRIQNASLDFLVVAAIATIRATVVLKGLVPLLLLVAVGIAWNVLCVMVLAPRVFHDAWFERSIAELGQSMGVTATGLLLLRVVDPDYKTPAADAFACKQLVHEPFMGGGLWTALAVPLVAIYGPLTVFLIASSVVVVWLAILFVPPLFAGRGE
jgi:ESS family glutamate:Na+ symporter